MKNNATLKSVLNRQFVALNTHMPLTHGRFDCNRLSGLGSEELSISIKPFECVYALDKELRQMAGES